MCKGTYEDIRLFVHGRTGEYVGGNHIADAKQKAGLPVRVASNRKTLLHRDSECPAHLLPVVFDAFKHFGMIPADAELPK